MLEHFNSIPCLIAAAIGHRDMRMRICAYARATGRLLGSSYFGDLYQCKQRAMCYVIERYS